MYSDPSGLEPKKEKSKAKLLVAPDNHFDDAGLFAMLNNMYEQQMRALKLRQDEELGRAIGLWNSFFRWKDDMWNKSQGGGRLGSGEKVNSKTTTLDKSNNKKKASKEKVNKKTGKIDFESDDARDEKKERLRQKLQFVGETSEEQEKFLDYLTDHIPEDQFDRDEILTVNIGLNKDEVGKLYEGDHLMGLYRHGEKTMYIASEFIDNPDYDRFTYFGTDGEKYSYNLWQVFTHEYGHFSDRMRTGNTSERSAEKRVNELRRSYGLPDNKRHMINFLWWYF